MTLLSEVTRAAALVVGILRKCIASEQRNSLMDDRRTYAAASKQKTTRPQYKTQYYFACCILGHSYEIQTFPTFPSRVVCNKKPINCTACPQWGFVYGADEAYSASSVKRGKGWGECTKRASLADDLSAVTTDKK